MREQPKTLNTQKKYDAQLNAAQQSAGQQIDRRCDKNLASLGSKVKRIIKDTVKSNRSKRKLFCLILLSMNESLSLKLLMLNLLRKDSDNPKLSIYKALPTNTTPKRKMLGNTMQGKTSPILDQKVINF